MTKTLALLLAALALAGCGSEDGGEAGGSDQVTVELAEQNGSGQSGTATLSSAGAGMTTVAISLSDPPAEPQPAHIHPGSCADLDPTPKYPLDDVVDGSSETKVNAPLEELEGGGLAINVHRSAAEVETYVACGDLGTGAGGAGDDGGGRYDY